MLILGIAKMGPPTDPQSVVNHELKVRIDRWEFKMNSFERQTIAAIRPIGHFLFFWTLKSYS